MMKYLLWLIAVFVLALGGVYFFNILDGKLFLLIGTTAYAVTLRWLFLVGILIVVLGWIAYKLLRFVFRLPGRWGRARQKRQLNKAAANFTLALNSFFEGGYKQTLASLNGIIAHKKARTLQVAATVLAAAAADRMNDFTKRDQYLDWLAAHDPDHDIFANLLRARGALKEQDYLAYQQYRDKVQSHHPKLTALAELELDYGSQSGNGEIVWAAAAQLKNNEAISAADFSRYRLSGFGMQLAAVKTAAELGKYLKSLDTKLWQNPTVSEKAARKYLELQRYEPATALVLKYYPANKSPELLAVLAESFDYLNDKEQLKLIATLEGWLKDDRDNTDLLLLLGNITYQKELWGKAKGYLEVCAANKPTLSGLITLAKLYENQGQTAKAAAVNRKIVALAAEDAA